MVNMAESLSTEEKDMVYAFYLQQREDKKSLIAQQRKLLEEGNFGKSKNKGNLRVHESESVLQGDGKQTSSDHDMHDDKPNKSSSKLVIIPVGDDSGSDNDHDQSVDGAPLNDSDIDDENLFGCSSDTDVVYDPLSIRKVTQEIRGDHSNSKENDVEAEGDINLNNESKSDENVLTRPEKKLKIICDTDEKSVPVMQSSEQGNKIESFSEGEKFSDELQQIIKSGRISTREAITIKKNLEQQENLNEGQMFDAEALEMTPFLFDKDCIPINWTEHRDIRSSSHYKLVELSRGQFEHDHIMSECDEAGLEVVKIERLENLVFLDRFKSEMTEMKRRTPDFQLNIRYLFHGTKVDKSRICEEGLDQRLSRMGFFGKGIYFSDNPLKCVHYADNSDTPEEAYILKCRVILGDAKVYADGTYDISLRREPEKEQPRRGWRYYDSVKGCPKDFNEYVVYENRRAMIEYIISFKADPRKKRTPSPRFNTTPNESALSIGQDEHVTSIDFSTTNQNAEITSIDFNTMTVPADEIASIDFNTMTVPADEITSIDFTSVAGGVEVTGTTDDLPTFRTEGADFSQNEKTDKHFERIRLVREEVRRKRARERGEDYIPPSSEQIEQERMVWETLQKKQCSSTERESGEVWAHSDATAEDGLRERGSSGGETSANLTWEEEETDPVAQVMNSLISEFQSLILTASSDVARSYIEMAQMDVNTAVELYLEDYS